MGIALIILVVWLILGITILTNPDDPSPTEYLFTWIALMLALVKEVFDKL